MLCRRAGRGLGVVCWGGAAVNVWLPRGLFFFSLHCPFSIVSLSFPLPCPFLSLRFPFLSLSFPFPFHSLLPLDDKVGLAEFAARTDSERPMLSRNSARRKRRTTSAPLWHDWDERCWTTATTWCRPPHPPTGPPRTGPPQTTPPPTMLTPTTHFPSLHAPIVLSPITPRSPRPRRPRPRRARSRRSRPGRARPCRRRSRRARSRPARSRRAWPRCCRPRRHGPTAAYPATVDSNPVDLP